MTSNVEQPLTTGALGLQGDPVTVDVAPTVGLTVKLTQDWNRQALARAVTGSYFDRDAGWWLLVDPTPRQAAVALRCFPELALEYPALVTLRDELLADARPFDQATAYNKRIAAPCLRARLAEL